MKTIKLASFPRYLVVCLARYYTSDDWQAKKLAVRVPMPATLDLTAARGLGPIEGEPLLPDDADDGAAAAAPPVAPAAPL